MLLCDFTLKKNCPVVPHFCETQTLGRATQNFSKQPRAQGVPPPGVRPTQAIFLWRWPMGGGGAVASQLLTIGDWLCGVSPLVGRGDIAKVVHYCWPASHQGWGVRAQFYGRSHPGGRGGCFGPGGRCGRWGGQCCRTPHNRQNSRPSPSCHVLWAGRGSS